MTTNTQAQENNSELPQKGPVFTDYGPVFKVADRDRPLKPDFVYKLIFDIADAAKSPDKLNRSIESVARFINMHALNSVPLENMQLAVVLHGSATRDGLSHEAYRSRHDIENPTLDLIEQLSAKGVSFYQCGQSAYFSKVAKEEFAEPIELALSAMTVLTELQAEGFQLLP